MPIVRDDADTLVYEAGVGEAGTQEQGVLMFCGLSFALIAAGMAIRQPWWQHLDVAERLATGLMFAAAVAAIAYFLCGAMSYVSCLAIDRVSRRVMCASKTLRGSKAEEFDFSQVHGAVVEMVRTKHGRWWQVRLKLDKGPGSVWMSTLLARRLGQNEANAMAAAIAVALGRAADPLPSPPDTAERTFAWLLKFTIGGLGILASVFISNAMLERWQAPTWPKAAGVVEKIELSRSRRIIGKESRMTDAIEIVYRYTVAGVQYRGTTFNFRKNILFAGDVPAIREHYRPGESCQVAYNPDQPARGVLVVGESGGELVLLAIFAAVLGLSGSGWTALNLWQLAFGKSGSTAGESAT